MGFHDTLDRLDALYERHEMFTTANEVDIAVSQRRRRKITNKINKQVTVEDNTTIMGKIDLSEVESEVK